MKRVTTIVTVVLFAAGSAIAGCEAKAKDATPQASSPSVAATTVQPDGVPDKVVVYYFHGNRRCRTCLGIQESIVKTVRERFAAETASGALTFQEINFEEPENKHFAKDYDLSFGSMVVAAQKGPATLKWENCNKVWDLAHNEPALTDYTDKQIRTFLMMLKRS
jgi:hypothetical protein